MLIAWCCKYIFIFYQCLCNINCLLECYLYLIENSNNIYLKNINFIILLLFKFCNNKLFNEFAEFILQFLHFRFHRNMGGVSLFTLGFKLKALSQMLGVPKYGFAAINSTWLRNILDISFVPKIMYENANMSLYTVTKQRFKHLFTRMFCQYKPVVMLL